VFAWNGFLISNEAGICSRCQADNEAPSSTAFFTLSVADLQWLELADLCDVENHLLPGLGQWLKTLVWLIGLF